ncbi:hypothetical protein GIB67_042862 [Kingdonia uniflora]|uniref:Fungal lipase-type domain-containing protein n=1 Tax=Kingdonia uniflora TaxID=39325 RepID=A0A7J7NS71_9MAGN|nr:hypothetical protein GIB67_042862 [Kingdonia uniflora]
MATTILTVSCGSEKSLPKDNLYDTTGFLSSLLGDECECHGYDVRIVGHSLGGAIGALLGLKLYQRYPNLHVYAYGSLPCVDSVIAEACSEFITSIVYNDEFSARLSVNSVLRLRAAAISALSQDSSADSAMICKLARRVLYIKKDNGNKVEAVSATCFERDGDEILYTDPVSDFADGIPSSSIASIEDPPEMYLPGLVIYIVPQRQRSLISLWKSWRTNEGVNGYKAYIANRDTFKDIVVSPYMFLDHLPWKCHYAMQKVLETRKAEVQLGESHMV